MAPKAGASRSSRTNNKSITEFFSRAPNLSQTWNLLNSSSDESPTPAPPTSDKQPATLPGTGKSDSLMPPAVDAPSSADMTNSSSSQLALRFSPRPQKTIMLPMDGPVPSPSQLQRPSDHSMDSFKRSSSPMSPLSSARDLPSTARSQPLAKRVTIGGQEVVRGSDEESDDSLELEDLDAILARRNPSVAVTQPQRGPQTGRVMKRTANGVKKPADPKANAQERINKMEKMRKDVQAAKESRERMAALNMKLNDNNSPSEATNTGKLEITEELLKATKVHKGNEDHEQIKRTMDAMKRIEALQQEIVWHFFDSNPPEPPPPAFPSKALSNEPWMAPLKNHEKRDTAFKSGFVARIAKKRPLPIDLQHWILDEICGDFENDDLVLAYINVLETAYGEFTNHLRPDKLRKLFTMVGARDTATNLGKVEEELQIAETVPRAIPPNARWLVETLRRLSPTMHRDSAKLAIPLLARLAIDDSVIKDVGFGLLIQQTLAALISSFPEKSSIDILQEISCTLYNAIKHEVLRCRLIEALPVTPARAHFFRRHLALAFALNKTPKYESSFENNALFSHVILFLKNCKIFQFRGNTDYSIVTAIVKVLDVAIDEGFAVPQIPSSDPSPPLTFTSSGKDEPQNPKDDFFKPKLLHKKPTDSLDYTFNESVDQLAEEVKILRDKIITNGATHISRLETRSALDRLLQRLQLAVRTRGPKHNDWYGTTHGVSIVKAISGTMNETDVGAQMEVD